MNSHGLSMLYHGVIWMSITYFSSLIHTLWKVFIEDDGEGNCGNGGKRMALFFFNTDRELIHAGVRDFDS